MDIKIYIMTENQLLKKMIYKDYSALFGTEAYMTLTMKQIMGVENLMSKYHTEQRLKILRSSN